MLNKQPDDPDVAGIGAYVEENFFNVGIGDHPVQALNALARGRLDLTKLARTASPTTPRIPGGRRSPTTRTTRSSSAP